MAIVDVPSGGTTGQVLTKTSNADYATSWQNAGGGGGVTSVSNSDGSLTVSPTTGGVISSINVGNTNSWTILQNFDDGAHVEKTGPVLTSNPSANQFDNEGGCDGTPFAMGDVLEVRVRSFKNVAGTPYGSINTSNSYIHTFTSNACVDADFQGDDYATIDGWVVEQNLNSSGWVISGTTGFITPSSGTVSYHLENNSPQPLLPTTVTTAVELGGYNDGARVYSVYSTSPARFSDVFVDNPFAVSVGGTGQTDGTLRNGAQSIDWFNRKLFNNSGSVVYDYGNNILYDNTGANGSIDPVNRQLLDAGGNLKIDYNLGWIYIGGNVRFLMNGTPTFASGVTTDVTLKLLPSGSGFSADILQFRNNNDSANLASFNNLAKFKACASTTAGASITITSGTAPTSPVDGDIWYNGTHIQARLGSTTYQVDRQAIAGSFSGSGTATTTFTVTIGATQANTSYKVVVTPTSALAAAVFYVNNKTTTTFDVVYLAGLTGTVTFDWALFP